MHNLVEGRTGFEMLGNQYEMAPNTLRKDITIAGIPCAWIKPTDAVDDDIVIYLHGGGFIFGSINSHTSLVSHIAQKLRRSVLIIDYRLAPEYPFPTGLIDCANVITTYCMEHPNCRFGIMGDSAGGNLAFATQLLLKEINGNMPQYSMVISPWVDLECKSDSFIRNRATEKILNKDYLLEAAATYAGLHQLSNGYLSPVNADLKGLPPSFILCGTAEILEDDSINLHQRLLEAGSKSELKLFKGQQHVWPFLDITTSASQLALNEMAYFVTKHSKIQSSVVL